MTCEGKYRGQSDMLAAISTRLIVAAVTFGTVALADVGPAIAQGNEIASSADTVVTGGQDSVTRSVKLGLNKSLVVDLPRDARDVLVSDPRDRKSVV